ncbi:DNA polymerase I [bacterium]|nr:MAG: DNA polymerase I [bacterium]
MSLVLIDGTALAYRSHYAFAKRPLTAPDGEITSVAFGFCNSVLRLIETRKPQRIAVVFDMKGPNFRHEMYPDYKAHRKPMPEELAAQLPRLDELLSAWGLPVYRQGGVEADDVIATMARRSAQAADPPDRVWLYSGDKDFMQLLDGRIGMLKPGRRGDEITELTADGVRRKFGLEPADLVQVFALAGDKSDNIPGAPGVGDKTALKLITEFGDLEGLYAGLEKSRLTPRLKRVLGENREQVFLSRDLFVIRDDVDMEVDWTAMDPVLPTGTKAAALLQELGLRRVQELAQKLVRAHDAAPSAGRVSSKQTGREPQPGKSQPAAPADAIDQWSERRTARGYQLLATDDDLTRWLARRDPARPLAVDTETDGLRRDTARLVGVCLAGWDLEGQRLPPAYVPVLWRETNGESAGGTLFPVGPEETRLASVRDLLAPVLADTGCLKVGQNLKFDRWILERHGMPLGGRCCDTMLASYVLDPGRQSHGLDALVVEFLDHVMMPYGDLFAAGDRLRDILAVDPDRLALYAAEDADYTLRLSEVLLPLLKESGLEGLFEDLEMPVSSVLLRMERHGIKLDLPFLADLKREFEQELERLQQQIHELAGEPFNIQSPKQLAVILFEKLGLKPVKKTATGWSTDVSVLTRLSAEHPLPAAILEFRQVAKLQNTYVETLPMLAHPATGLVHTSYNQAVAATGRLSSSDPNLQNIPIRTELGRRIRRAFIPRAPDNVFLSADYSQVELRLLAHLAEDPGLLAAFREGADVHRRTAALIAGISEDEVTPDMRGRAKAINFGVIYGMGARALARQIEVTVKEAAAFIESYFATYPGVRSFIESTRESARDAGSVVTMLGRRRLLPDILAENPGVRSFQERAAVNTPIQGTAADLIKLAMLRIDHELARRQLSTMLLLQVHDELVLEVPRGELDEVRVLVREGMEGALELNVPLVVDMHTGGDWSEAHG